MLVLPVPAIPFSQQTFGPYNLEIHHYWVLDKRHSGDGEDALYLSQHYA